MTLDYSRELAKHDAWCLHIVHHPGTFGPECQKEPCLTVFKIDRKVSVLRRSPEVNRQ